MTVQRVPLNNVSHDNVSNVCKPMTRDTHTLNPRDVRNIAWWAAAKYGIPKRDWDECVQVAWEAALVALRSYNPSHPRAKGPARWAVRPIRQAVQKFAMFRYQHTRTYRVVEPMREYAQYAATSVDIVSHIDAHRIECSRDLFLHVCEERTFQQLGNARGVSRQRMQQRISKELEKLRAVRRG